MHWGRRARMKAPTSASFRCLLGRLPPPMVLLVLGGFVDVAAAYALTPAPAPKAPRSTSLPTSTLPHHALDVVSSWPWPIAAMPPTTTPPPLPPPPPPPLPTPRQPTTEWDRLVAPADRDLRRRDIADDTNTVCGYIGGDSGLAATCSAGSHCVLDTIHSVVGCCPNGQAACTTGVFTGCVDYNSGDQTLADPYVYTCTNSDLCYKNSFAGGYYQWGCGTLSNLATNVPFTADGITSPLDLPSVSVKFTESPGTVAGATDTGANGAAVSASDSSSESGGNNLGAATTGTDTTPSSSSVTATGSSSSGTTAGPSSPTTGTSASGSTGTSPTSSSTSGSAGNNSTAPPSASSRTSSGSNSKAAIIGGVIGAAIALIALMAIIAFYCRRRAKKFNKRERVGSISPPLGDDMHPVDGVLYPFSQPRRAPMPPGDKMEGPYAGMYPAAYPHGNFQGPAQNYAGMDPAAYPDYDLQQLQRAQEAQAVQQLWNTQELQRQQQQQQSGHPNMMEQTQRGMTARNFHLPNAYSDTSSNRSREGSMAVGGGAGVGKGKGTATVYTASSYYGTRGPDGNTLPLAQNAATHLAGQYQPTDAAAAAAAAAGMADRPRPPRTSGDHQDKPLWHQQRGRDDIAWV